SKHHTGLAADINESKDVELETITSTKLYKYMKEDNYLNLKRFGFIPSYPEGGNNMGPFPEAWEILYVGPETLQSSSPS
ncbi:MAG: D-alanyl-D-alanine carboxypeptidase family protein, partial [Patescibacteria group bacterium]